MSLRRSIAYAFVGLVAIVAALLVLAPASLADLALARATAGRLRLAETTGTLWQGKGRVVLADVSSERPEGATALQGMVLPGTLDWTVRLLPLFVGVLDATLRLDGMSAPLRLQGSATGLTGTASSLELPAVDLGRLGSPWNTIRPSAFIALRWDGFRMSAGQVEGRMSVELRDVSSAMTPVHPLGSYRVDVTGAGPQATVALVTLAGPLRLTGQGNWTARSGLRVTAEAVADESERERLSSFLVLVGRREGDRVIIKIGA